MNSLFKSIMNIKKKELPLALLMFLYFFLVIVSFWILKPIKKAIFLTYYDQTGFILLNAHRRFQHPRTMGQSPYMAV